MAEKRLPLKEVSIQELFSGNEKSVYEIPIYQRNYAWEKDEITALVQDVYDAYKKDASRPYYIGTLVSYHKGDQVYEVIDGQQRLTTLRLILDCLGLPYSNRLTYRARKKSDRTLKAISGNSHASTTKEMPGNDVEERDKGIENGYRYAKAALGEIVSECDRQGFHTYFQNKVHIIHYQVPKDIDLNHYFEVMNSRGEQLEKHEIEKANLMEILEDDLDRKVFNRIWESCSDMSVYIQQNMGDMKAEKIFGNTLYEFKPKNFEEIVKEYRDSKSVSDDNWQSFKIKDIIHSNVNGRWAQLKAEEEKKDSFLPIIDFPNFLLIVLKITRMNEDGFSPTDFNLDDKELLNEFSEANMTSEMVKKFAYILLKARFLLDNYIVHHSKEEDTIDSNPWKLQVWHHGNDAKKGQLRNLSDDKPLQDRLAHLLSMFEVSFTARQRKNYLFYCLLYLIDADIQDIQAYAEFTENLADRYFYRVYLDGSKLNAINTPVPGSFDEAVLVNDQSDNTNSKHYGLDKSLSEKKGSNKDQYDRQENKEKSREDFVAIYGDGTVASKGVPLFIFNYLDYKLWKLYDESLRGKESKEGNKERKDFFEKLGCGDFGLNLFDQFYFSRTRRSLEHYYPQATATGEAGTLDQNQINCFGNYAMIGSEANSSGSNWSPLTKLTHYLDSSHKIGMISVASLKFMIMMQLCKDHQAWEFEEIKDHQEKMIAVMMGNDDTQNNRYSHDGE